jgi:mRNA deadenylase 3'-5' endonuclease subunit Ccr4
MGRHQKKSKKTTKKKKAFKDNNSTTARSDSWVDNVRFQVIEGKDDDDSTKSTSTLPTTLSIISWNVLAEAYCSRYSQVHLPVQYQKVVFSKSKRKERIVAVLEQLCSSENSVDVACLQEVDLPEIGATLRSIGYTGVETPCVVGGGAGGRTDACALYVRSTARWQLVDHEIVRLDDLATLSTSTSSTANESTTSLENQYKKSSNAATANSDTSNVQGMQMSLLRRNMAVIARLQDTVSKQTVLVANAHLYWNPGFEYVKVRIAFACSLFLLHLAHNSYLLYLLLNTMYSCAKRTTY